jgi:proline dehydrogenase
VQALAAVERLNAEGLMCTLDVLGEDVSNGDAARRVCASYLDLIDRVAASGCVTNLSLKVSALGLSFDPGQARTNFERILDAASAKLDDPFVRIDMEGYALLEPTLAFFEAVWPARTNTGPVLQAYLHRTPADVARMVELGARVRLCKGAYQEPPDIAVRGRKSVQSHFMACAVQLLRGGVYPAIATHDPALIGAIREIAPALGRTKDDFEFQLLYGVRPDLQRELVQAGYLVRVYVPFGTHWARYLRRRMLERRENLMFALRSFAGGK